MPDVAGVSSGFQFFVKPAGRTIANGLQTNGTLLEDEWGRFLAAEGFAVGPSLDGPPGPKDLRAG